jgi:hypothetical protein
MAGTMALEDLVADLKVSLHSSASVFDSDADADYLRFLNQALPDMAVKRRLTRLGQVTVDYATVRYALSEYPDLVTYKTHLWDLRGYCPQPWEPGYPGALPRVTAEHDGSAHWLVFDPAPSAEHIALRGSTFKFWYFARHTLGAEASGTTVLADDRGLLLLRAQAEAMRELALNQGNKPINLRDGLSGTPRNSTPAALHEMLLRLFWEAR